MSLGYYIKELLDDHDYVVLPGFGAFIASITEARFAEKNNRLLPPARRISFNPDIKINDGILLNHFAHRKQLTAAKAHLDIAQLCEDLRYRLDHDETVDIEGLGILKRQGVNYIFTAFQDAESWPGAYGLEPVEVSFRNEPPVKTVPASSASSGIGDPKRESLKKFYWLLVIPALVMVLIFMLSPKEEPALPDLNIPADSQTAIEMKQEPQTANGFAVDSQGGLNLEDQTQMGDEEQLPVTSDDTNRVDREEVNREPSHPANHLYYLVGGSFKTRENADQYFKKMKQQGYQPLYLGEIKSFHIVAIAYYTSEREAVNAQNTILGQDSSSGVWVYHRSVND